ncbi:MAG: succinylglutamate desuccinylase/aspartoacylase family protein [Candidatus Methanomethylicaceae archaeon]
MSTSAKHPDGSLTIGDGTARPGEVVRCGIPIGRDIYGNVRRLPIIILNGVADGPILWLNGGTHGDEPEGAFSIFKLLNLLKPAELRGAVVACPVMNPEAFVAASRGNPADQFTFDMNRIYPGDPNGYPTARVAAAHFEAMHPVCDLQINIHSGGGHSYLAEVIFCSQEPASLELAAAMGPEWNVIMSSPTGKGNPTSQLAAMGKAAISVELGGLCRTLTRDFHTIANKLCQAYINVLRHYKMLPGHPVYAEKWYIGHQETILSPATGMWVAREDLTFLTITPKNELLGWIYDIYGNIVCEIRTPCEGMVFGVRSRPQVVEGEWLCFYAVIEKVCDNLLQSCKKI